MFIENLSNPSNSTIEFINGFSFAQLHEFIDSLINPAPPPKFISSNDLNHQTIESKQQNLPIKVDSKPKFTSTGINFFASNQLNVDQKIETSNIH